MVGALVVGELVVRSTFGLADGEGVGSLVGDDDGLGLGFCDGDFVGFAEGDELGLLGLQ